MLDESVKVDGEGWDEVRWECVTKGAYGSDREAAKSSVITMKRTQNYIKKMKQKFWKKENGNRKKPTGGFFNKYFLIHFFAGEMFSKISNNHVKKSNIFLVPKNKKILMLKNKF